MLFISFIIKRRYNAGEFRRKLIYNGINGGVIGANKDAREGQYDLRGGIECFGQSGTS